MKEGQKVTGIDREKFILFCSELTITAKEGKGGSSIVPMELLPTQVYLLDEILEGLSRGVHYFVVLKCRQSGTTTLGLAFELWWCFSHPGFILNFIADGNKRLAFNRAMLVEMAESLAEKPEWGAPIRDDNKEMLSFANRSKVLWNNANARDEGGLGRGVGVMGFHATEPARYKDEDAWNAMQDGLAKRNPHRFYLVEGTSEGPNLFKEIWDEASSIGNISQKSVFIGWWLHPDYDTDLATEEGKRIFEVYWQAVPRLSREEEEWVRGVKERYGFEIRPSQIAWWRFELKESKRGNLEMQYQEYPPLPEYAWLYGGKSYVSATAVNIQVIKSKANIPKNRFFQVEFGPSFHETRIVEVGEKESWYDLVTFEEPQQGPNLRYAIGVDPAHGASEASDACAISVWAAYSDQMVQVAEYNASEEPSYHMAWVLLLLAGAYNSQTLVNCELQGGGYALMDHIRHLQEQLAAGYDNKLSAYFQDLRFYTYSRPDAVHRAYASFNWITSNKTKEIMLSYWRDLFEQGIVECRSPELISQTQQVRRLRDGTIETPGTDHRLMAAAIASMAFKQLLETDIGGVEACARSNVERYTPGRETTGVVTDPASIMQDRLLNWRNDLLRNQAEEKASLEIPDWVEELQERARNSPWR